jgi:site-specific DNA-methyltransferase (adenine-specific)
VADLPDDVAKVLAGETRWALVEGDNASVLPLLPDKSVAHVITDPPYEAEAHTLQRRIAKGTRPQRATGWKATDRIIEAPLGFSPIGTAEREQAGAEFARIAQRWIVVFCQVEAAVRWGDALQAGGAATKRIGIWVKPDGMPQYSGDRPGMGYESIVFAHAKGRSRWNGGGRVGVFVHNKNDPDRAGHETQKPLSLMLELVELFTDPGDLVCDPYAGSGTTGVACLRLGRRFLGIESNPVNAAVARERLEAESRGLTLRDARAGQLSLLEVANG